MIVRHAWTGDPRDSASTRTVDGVEVARNLSQNSRVAMNNFWAAGTGTTTTLQVTPPIPHPLGIETSCETASTSNSVYLSRVYYFGTSNYPDGGAYIGLWILVPPGYRTEAHGGFPEMELPANEWVFVKTTEKVTGVASGIRIKTVDDSNAGPDLRGYLTGAIVSDTPIASYFDGDTPDFQIPQARIYAHDNWIKLP